MLVSLAIRNDENFMKILVVRVWDRNFWRFLGGKPNNGESISDRVERKVRKLNIHIGYRTVMDLDFEEQDYDHRIRFFIEGINLDVEGENV